MIMNAIFTRRSVRDFTEKKIEAEKMDKILRAAMQAPSAANQQPWQFIVVSAEEKLSVLSGVSPYAACLKGAAAAIIVLGSCKDLTYPEFCEQDLAAATQNILLQATELGLGSVWLGVMPDQDRMNYIRRLLELESDLNPFCIVALGHPENLQANTFADRYKPHKVKYID